MIVINVLFFTLKKNMFAIQIFLAISYFMNKVLL